MAKNQAFAEWCGGATESEIAQMEASSRKSFWKWFLISLIPLVGFLTVGVAAFCYNTHSFIKTRGHSDGSNLVRFIFLLWGGIIIPIIEVQLLSKSDKTGYKVLGFDKILKKQER